MRKIFVSTIRGSWLIKGVRVEGYRLNILLEDLRILVVSNFPTKELCSKQLFKSSLRRVDSILPGYHYFNKENNYIELKIPRKYSNLDILKIVKESPYINNKSRNRIEEKIIELSN